MKNIILSILILSIPLFATGPRVTQSLISPDKKEIFAVDLPPFISTEVDDGGVLTEIVSAACKEVNLDMIVTILPLQSMVKYYLTQENAMGVMGRHIGLSSEEKSSILEIPIYVAQERYLYYKPKHKSIIEYSGKLSSLNGLTYGASKGEDTSMYKDAGINVKKARTLSLFKKLQSGKVDFISIPEESASWFIKEKFPEHLNDFVMMKKSSAPTAVSLYFNLNNSSAKQSADEFKKGLKNIIDNGIYADILKQHVKSRDKVESQIKRMNEYLK